jgi:hypothetical protein
VYKGLHRAVLVAAVGSAPHAGWWLHSCRGVGVSCKTDSFFARSLAAFPRAVRRVRLVQMHQAALE